MTEFEQQVAAALMAVPHELECASRTGYERQGSGCICDRRYEAIAARVAAAIRAASPTTAAHHESWGMQAALAVLRGQTP